MHEILLIGGNGYIGSKFYEQYHKIYNITSYDLCLFEKDLGYSHKLNYGDLIAENLARFNTVILLAGHSSVQMTEFSPIRSWANNVEYFRRLCSILPNGTKLIYASSASVYGNRLGQSTEKDLINLHTINHYDLQKITIDLIANRYINSGSKIIGLRFGTVNGIAPNTRSELMLNSMVNASITHGKIRVKNTHIRRAILGINDLSKCLSLLVEKDCEYGQYNLASFNSTVNDLSQVVSEITGSEIEYGTNDLVAYDFMMDCSKFAKSTGYVFKDTPETIILELSEKIQSVVLSTRDNDNTFINHYG